MVETIQIGLIALVGWGHVKLFIDTMKPETKAETPAPKTTVSANGVPFYLYGQFVAQLKLKE